MTFSQIDPKLITIPEGRQRSAFKIEDLKPSIARRGILNPIIVTQDNVLVAGERRLRTSLELGLELVPIRALASLNPIEISIIELEENLKRQDLSWQDTVRAVGRIHQLYCDANPDWHQFETAEAIGVHEAWISIQLTVFRAMDDPRINGAGTVLEARNILARRQQRAAGDALQDLIELVAEPAVTSPEAPKISREAEVECHPAEAAEGPRPAPPATMPPATKPAPAPAALTPRPPSGLMPEPAPTAASDIQHLDFLSWAPTYSGPKFNLIHCDFPYGVNLFDGKQGLGAEGKAAYTDTRDTYIELLTCLCTHLDRLMSVSGHLLFWYSAKHQDTTTELFSALAPSLKFQPYPLVWVKSDNAGISNDAKRNPRHVYETCLMASRGERQIVKIVGDAYTAPSDRSLHPSAKPEPMLRHFFSMLVDEHTTLLDPTCGSATALRAADSLGAKRVLGLEIDPDAARVAQGAWKSYKALKGNRR
jgi:ParB family chromosome partitioning protein